MTRRILQSLRVVGATVAGGGGGGGGLSLYHPPPAPPPTAPADLAVVQSFTPVGG
jgi:hypothetical protein